MCIIFFDFSKKIYNVSELYKICLYNIKKTVHVDTRFSTDTDDWLFSLMFTKFKCEFNCFKQGNQL